MTTKNNLKVLQFPNRTSGQKKEVKVPESAELYAALGRGTNCCRRVIAQPNGSQFHVVDSFSKSVQLGVGLERSGRLSKVAMARTIGALMICQKNYGIIVLVGCD